MNERAVMLMTTVGSDEQTETICTMLLERRLAACIQALPITSRYRWQGAVQRDQETLLLIKTSGPAAEAAIEAIRQHHEYDTPEIVAVPITEGLTAYLQWLDEVTDAPGA